MSLDNLYCTADDAKKVETFARRATSLPASSHVEQAQVGHPARDLGRIAFAPVGERNDREPPAWKALEHGAEADGLAVMPHRRLAAIRADEPAETITCVLIGEGDARRKGQLEH